MAQYEENKNLRVSPVELKFALQINKTLQQKLTLTNVSNEKVAFKVKTTAPKRYCVRPNAQILEPGKSQEVQVLLQPLKELPENNVCKDKFLVQSVTLADNDPPQDDLKNFWDVVTESRKADVIDQKLKCVFTRGEDPPSDALPQRSPEPAPTAASPNAQPSSVAMGNVAEKDRLHRQEIEARDNKIKNLSDERSKLVDSLESVKKNLQELQSRSNKPAVGVAPPVNAVAPKGGGTNFMLIAVVGLVCALLGHFIPDLLM